MKLTLGRLFLLFSLFGFAIMPAWTLAQDRSAACSLFEVHLNGLLQADAAKATVRMIYLYPFKDTVAASFDIHNTTWKWQNIPRGLITIQVEHPDYMTAEQRHAIGFRGSYDNHRAVFFNMVKKNDLNATPLLNAWQQEPLRDRIGIYYSDTLQLDTIRQLLAKFDVRKIEADVCNPGGMTWMTGNILIAHLTKPLDDFNNPILRELREHNATWATGPVAPPIVMKSPFYMTSGMQGTCATYINRITYTMYDRPGAEQDLEKIRANKWVIKAEVNSSFPMVTVTLDPGIGPGIFDLAYEWQLLDSVVELRVETVAPTVFP